MYANRNGQLMTGDCCTGNILACEEHYWIWRATPTPSIDDFTFVDWLTRKCLFSNSDGRFGIFTCVSTYNDQYWTAQRTSNPNRIIYRFKNEQSSKCIAINNNNEIIHAVCTTDDNNGFDRWSLIQ